VLHRGSNHLLWALTSATALATALFFAIRFQLAHPPSARVAVLEQKAQAAEQIRLGLAWATEAEKSAVLAVTDQESIAFADQARAATTMVEKERKSLEALLQTHGSSREADLLSQFSKAFSEFQRVDRELLDLAVKNTNVKASALAFGPAAEAMKEMDGALSRLSLKAVKSSASSAKEQLLLLADARAAALRIEVLLPPHIAEESDEKMDRLESQMAGEDRQVREDLSRLETLLPSENADLKTATSSYSHFAELKGQILKLSRENTNVRSLSISLNQKRRVTVLCEETLSALAKAIEAERAESAGRAPASPR
jgi:hypothetical protein